MKIIATINQKGEVIITRYDRRKKLRREIIETIKSHPGEAPGYGRAIYDYNPRSAGAQDYRQLCRETPERNAHI